MSLVLLRRDLEVAFSGRPSVEWHLTTKLVLTSAERLSSAQVSSQGPVEGYLDSVDSAQVHTAPLATFVERHLYSQISAERIVGKYLHSAGC